MNAGSSTTEPLTSFPKLKDLWAWRSSRSSTPSEDHYGRSSCAFHPATFCFIIKPWLMYCSFLLINKLNPNACQTHTRSVLKCGASVESVSQPMHYVTEPQFGSTMSLLAQCAFYTMLRLVRPYMYAEIYAAKRNLCDVTKRFFFCPCCIAGCFFCEWMCPMLYDFAVCCTLKMTEWLAFAVFTCFIQ